MSESREKTMRLTHIALLIAMNCISAYLIIPCLLSVAPGPANADRQLSSLPLTAQRCRHHHAGLYRIGLIGVPVFTGGTSGPGKMFGPTGGYIWLMSSPSTSCRC